MRSSSTWIDCCSGSGKAFWRRDRRLNTFGSQFERVLPASSAANLYPFNYSGKTDSQGFYLGRDKFGSNVIADFDQRDEDKTNANILILGNSGQGKSHLLKLILCNILESGKAVLCLDPEHEYIELCENMGGCFVDLMSGQYLINPLEPKTWDEGGGTGGEDAPQTFLQRTKLSQHISFLKDFFRCYKDFTDRHIDLIEIMLAKLYDKWGISDQTNFSQLTAEAYPILSDLYTLIESEYQGYDREKHQLYTDELLQELLLGLHSICKGAESKFFNGRTNVTSDRFIVFGVKGLLQASRNVKNTLLFNVLSFMSDKLLTEGNTAASIDELYLFLSNLTSHCIHQKLYEASSEKKNPRNVLSSQNLDGFQHRRASAK